MSGVMLTAALNAGGALALDFNFTFTGTGAPTSPVTVSGLIRGLVDNMNDQTSGITVTITSATNIPSGGWPSFSNVQFGDGFDVSAGVITGVTARFESNSSSLVLNNQTNPFTQYLFVDSNLINQGPSSTLTFTPVIPSPTAVPGPLPLLGAAFAFRASRQLRRRLKATA
jgi:hypothetical protein